VLSAEQHLGHAGSTMPASITRSLALALIQCNASNRIDVGWNKRLEVYALSRARAELMSVQTVNTNRNGTA